MISEKEWVGQGFTIGLLGPLHMSGMTLITDLDNSPVSPYPKGFGESRRVRELFWTFRAAQ